MGEKMIYGFMTKVFGLDLLLMMEDTTYMLKRESHYQEFQLGLQEFRERHRNGFIMGGSFGLALLLSLRRYFPAQFGTFSINRALIEVLILSGSLIGSTLSVVLGSAKLVHAIKKQYILQADPDFYSHMRLVGSKYSVSEDAQVRYTLSSEQFQGWKQYRNKHQEQIQ